MPLIPLRLLTSVFGLALGYYVGWFLEYEYPEQYDNYDRVIQQVCLNLGRKVIGELDSSDEDDFDCLCGDYGTIATSDEDTEYSE